MADAFIGKFEVESKENFEEFMKNLGKTRESFVISFFFMI